MKIIWIAVIVLGGLLPVNAQVELSFEAGMVTADSLADGSGRYELELSRGTNGYVFALESGDTGGGVIITATNLTTVSSPAGWAAATVSNTVTWTYTGSDTWYIEDTPVTLSYESTDTDAAVYDRSPGNSNPPGLVYGRVYTTNHLNPNGAMVVGFEKFSHVGPAESVRGSLFRFADNGASR